LARYQEDLRVWNECLLQVRQSCPHLNFISTSLLCQFYRVVELLATNGPASAPAQVTATEDNIRLPFFEEILCNFRSVVASDFLVVHSFFARLVVFWANHVEISNITPTPESHAMHLPGKQSLMAEAESNKTPPRPKAVIRFAATLLKHGLQDFIIVTSATLVLYLKALLSPSKSKTAPILHPMRNMLCKFLSPPLRQWPSTRCCQHSYTKMRVCPRGIKSWSISATVPFHEIQNMQ